jgi:hypothetical protein
MRDVVARNQISPRLSRGGYQANCVQGLRSLSGKAMMAGWGGQAEHRRRPYRTLVTERLEARERRMRTRSIYSDGGRSISIPEYPKIIREARAARNGSRRTWPQSLTRRRASSPNGGERDHAGPNDALLKKLSTSWGSSSRRRSRWSRPKAGVPRSRP